MASRSSTAGGRSGLNSTGSRLGGRGTHRRLSGLDQTARTDRECVVLTGEIDGNMDSLRVLASAMNHTTPSPEARACAFSSLSVHWVLVRFLFLDYDVSQSERRMWQFGHCSKSTSVAVSSSFLRVSAAPVPCVDLSERQGTQRVDVATAEMPLLGVALQLSTRHRWYFVLLVGRRAQVKSP